MKKTIAIILISVLVLTVLVGCSKKEEDLVLSDGVNVEKNKDKEIIDDSKTSQEREASF